MDLWQIALLFYFTGLTIAAAVGIGDLYGEFSSKEERRSGALVVLLAPVWPLALPLSLVGCILYMIFTLYRRAWKVLRGEVVDF